MATEYLDKAGAVYLVNKIRDLISSSVSVKANTASPAFTGTPTAPTQTAGTNSTAIATTAFVTSAINGIKSDVSTKANTASPAFTGTPTAPTQAAGTNSTAIATTAFVAAAVASAVNGITGVKYQIVTSLPTSGAVGTIYLKAHSHGSGDAYDEYIWVDKAFEKIGSTDIDLSGYLKKSDVTAISNSEIDAMLT